MPRFQLLFLEISLDYLLKLFLLHVLARLIVTMIVVCQSEKICKENCFFVSLDMVGFLLVVGRGGAVNSGTTFFIVFIQENFK
jgi:hypothetical protein